MKISRRYHVQYRRMQSTIWNNYHQLNGQTHTLEDADRFVERAHDQLPGKEIRLVVQSTIEMADEPKEYKPGTIESIIEDRLADWLYWGTVDFEQLPTLIASEIRTEPDGKCPYCNEECDADVLSQHLELCEEGYSKNLAEARIVWAELGDILVNDDGLIEEPFRQFESGTDREEIWHWIEDEFDLSIRSLNGAWK